MTQPNRSLRARVQRARRCAEDARAADLRGDPEHALALYDEALAQLERAPQHVLLADVLRWKGTTHRERGETQQALELYERSLGVAVAVEAPASQAHALNCLGIVAQRRGDMTRAEECYAAAHRLALGAGDQLLVGMIRQNGGVLASIRGDYHQARVAYEESFDAFRAAGNDEAACWVLNNLGMLHCAQGQYPAFADGLRSAQARGDRRMEGLLQLNTAELLVGLGRLDEALEHCACTLTFALERGDRLQAAEALKCRAGIEQRRGRFDAAEASLTRAAGLADVAEDALLSAEIMRALGHLKLERGQRDDAQRAWRAAADAFADLGAVPQVEDVTRQLRLVDGPG